MVVRPTGWPLATNAYAGILILSEQEQEAMKKKHAGPADQPPETIKIEGARKAKLLSDNAVQLAEFAATALVAAEALRIKAKPLKTFKLSGVQRGVLLNVPSISKQLRAKLTREKASFTAADVASLIMTLAEASTEGEAESQVAILLVAKHLAERLNQGVSAAAEPKSKKAKEPNSTADPGTVFQFKITLLNIKPAIWRRIQIPDCTLTDFHEYIQAAFGWQNCHLHQFDIDGEQYSQPAPDGDDFGMEFKDEAGVLLSKLIPKSGRKSRWIYEYDFGDGWRHEVLFEGFPPHDPKAKYPLCVEGERACPPEDCGGPWGYAEYLVAIADPQHEEHEAMLEWRGPFDPEAFDAKQATRAMTKTKRQR
jgi:hypothetical protein